MQPSAHYTDDYPELFLCFVFLFRCLMARKIHPDHRKNIHMTFEYIKKWICVIRNILAPSGHRKQDRKMVINIFYSIYSIIFVFPSLKRSLGRQLFPGKVRGQPKQKFNRMQNSANYRNKTPYFGFPHYNYLHIYKTQAECDPFIALFTC